MTKWRVHPEEEPTRAAQALADQVERDGGTVLTLYREPVGDHWQIFVPPELAYGERGQPPRIGPNEALVFELKLVDIK